MTDKLVKEKVETHKTLINVKTETLVEFPAKMLTEVEADTLSGKLADVKAERLRNTG